MFTLSKDPQVLDRQLEQKSLLLKANLVAATSEAVAIVSINNATLTATVIQIDVKEAISSCEKVQIVNRATGANISLAAAPSVSGSVISVTVNGTGASDVCIVADYRN
jgi:hypothetical protein